MSIKMIINWYEGINIPQHEGSDRDNFEVTTEFLDEMIKRELLYDASRKLREMTFDDNYLEVDEALYVGYDKVKFSLVKDENVIFTGRVDIGDGLEYNQSWFNLARFFTIFGGTKNENISFKDFEYNPKLFDDKYNEKVNLFLGGK